MKRRKGLLSALLVLVLTILLAGCAASLETELSVDRGFSGKRVMTCSFSQRDLQNTGMSLSELLEKSCPEELSWSVQPTDTGESCTLTLSFSSQAEYVEKVTALLNAGTRRDPDYHRTPFVVYSTPDSILTSGCRLTEDFTSADLLEWLIDAFDDATGRPSGILFQFTRNAVIADGGSPVPVSKFIDLNSLTAEKVARIEIQTTQEENALRYTRVVRVVFPQRTVDVLGTALTDFLRDSLPDGAKSVWTDGDGEKTYTAVFKTADLAQIERDTQTFFHSDQASLKETQLTETSTPTVDERAVEESIDLSGFFSGGNGGTQVSYTFTGNSHTKLSQGSVYGTGEWTKSEKIIDHRTFRYEGDEDVARFRFVLSETHLIEAVSIAMKQNGDGTFTREMTFAFDRERGHGGAEYCARYFNEITPTAATATAEQRGKQELCVLTMRGSASQLTPIVARLFGEGNAVSFAETQTAFTLKNYLIYRDKIALTRLLGDGNDPTPLSYSLTLSEEEAPRFLSLEYTDQFGKQRKLTDPELPGVFAFQIGNADTEVGYDGSSFNVGGVIVLVILTLLVTALLVGVFLLMLRTGNDPWFDDEENCALAAREAEEARAEAKRRRAEKKNRP